MKRTAPKVKESLRDATARKAREAGAPVYNSLDASRQARRDGEGTLAAESTIAARSAFLSRPRPVLKAVGKRGKANLSADRRFSRTVKAKALGFCQRCGEPGVHAHHALTKAAFPEYRINPAVGCWVCAMCHAWAHEHPAEFVRWWALESAEFAALLATARRIDK